MSTSDEQLIGYLLGELSEAERERLERDMFVDSALFDRLVTIETALVDSYVRGRLPADDQRRFEQFYLADSRRRERVKFAETLAERIDRAPIDTNSVPEERQEAHPAPVWRARFQPFGLLSAAAVLAALAVATTSWFTSRQLRGDLMRAEAQRAASERDLQQRLAEERARAETLARAIETLRGAAPADAAVPRVPGSAPFVSLVLTANVRRQAQTGAPATLVIPPGTETVRIQLSLDEAAYPRYQLFVQAIGAAEIYARAPLTMRTIPSRPVLVLDIPADKFSTGDYLLTVRGESPAGDFEDVSKSLFHVDRR